MKVGRIKVVYENFAVDHTNSVEIDYLTFHSFTWAKEAWVFAHRYIVKSGDSTDVRISILF